MSEHSHMSIVTCGASVSMGWRQQVLSRFSVAIEGRF